MKASFVVDSALQNDRVFDLENRILNRDDCLYGFWALRNALKDLGIELHTADINSVETSDVILLNERPSRAMEAQLRKLGLLKKCILMVFESSLIRPDNWDLKFHEDVAGVLTWSSDLLGGKSPASKARYIRGGFTHKFPAALPTAPREKFCTLIAGNKMVSDRRELYSKRREAIQWFEKNAPQDFTYFGVGWEHFYLKGGFGTKVLRKIGALKWLPEIRTQCFGGKVQTKLETLSQFEFSICFENAKDIPGYISEKIFDCFFAGCIPVYWGAPDIADYIPKTCYIDFTEFSGFAELYRFLKSLTAEEKLAYRQSITEFLGSRESQIFNADFASRFQADAIFQIASRASVDSRSPAGAVVGSAP